MVRYVNSRFSEVEPKNLAVTLKCLQEQLFMVDIFKPLDWVALEKYFFDAVSRDNNMVFLTNLSYLEKYLTGAMKTKLFKQTLNRVQKESKMDFIQSRYFALNLTALARLYISKAYSLEERKQVQEVAKMWALLIPQKMQIIKGREGVFANDLAIMAFQLTKLQLSDITDVYIYLENQLIENSSKLGFQPLFMLLQSFGQYGMHSQKLYLTVLEKVYQLSNAFERMNPLEFSILLSCLSQGII